MTVLREGPFVCFAFGLEDFSVVVRLAKEV